MFIFSESGNTMNINVIEVIEMNCKWRGYLKHHALHRFQLRKIFQQSLQTQAKSPFLQVWDV
jgi:hypothetical protein